MAEQRKKRTLRDIREQARAGAARAREKKIAEGLRRVQIWVPAAEVEAAAANGLFPRQVVYAAQTALLKDIEACMLRPDANSYTLLNKYLSETPKK